MNMLDSIKKTLNLMFLQKIQKATPLDGLEGKVVLVTGGSKGIGKETASYLYDQGCNIAVISTSKDELIKEFPTDKYANIGLYEADIRHSEEVEAAINSILSKFGKIDVVVNNAGINTEKALDNCTDTDINNLVDVNIKGTLNVCSKVIPIMKSQRDGTIINIGSKISHNTNVGPNKVLYALTKYAIEGLSFALNKELKGTGIRVVCLMPGTVNTFVSTNAGNFMAPIRIAQIIGEIIKFNDIDFEGVIFKDKDQNI